MVFLSGVLSQVLEKVCSKTQGLERAWRSPLFSPFSLCLKSVSALDLIGFTHPSVQMLLPETFKPSILHSCLKSHKVFLPERRESFKSHLYLKRDEVATLEM